MVSITGVMPPNIATPRLKDKENPKHLILHGKDMAQRAFKGQQIMAINNEIKSTATCFSAIVPA